MYYEVAGGLIWVPEPPPRWNGPYGGKHDKHRYTGRRNTHLKR